jgi:uncharacterized coiled-coil protein SlyX
MTASRLTYIHRQSRRETRMTKADQPPSIEDRLSRLENLFANIGETVFAQNDAIAAISSHATAQSNTIDVLVANIQELTENVNTVTNRVDNLYHFTLWLNFRRSPQPPLRRGAKRSPVYQVFRQMVLAIQAERDRQAFREQMSVLAESAAQDRAQAAQDRQQAAIDRQEFRTEIRRIWEYLRDRNGGSSPPQ